MPLGGGRDHARSERLTITSPRTRAQVDDKLGTGLDDPRNRVDRIGTTTKELLVVPTVFANDHTDLGAAQLEHVLLRRRKRLEVARFVKDVVGRQQALARNNRRGSVAQARHRVVQFSAARLGGITIGFQTSHQHINAGRHRLGQLDQGSIVRG